MRFVRNVVAALAVAILLCSGVYAGSDLNEVGAFLVYPTIVAVGLGDERAPLSMRGSGSWPIARQPGSCAR